MLRVIGYTLLAIEAVILLPFLLVFGACALLHAAEEEVFGPDTDTCTF